MVIYFTSNFEGPYGLKNRMSNNLYQFYYYLSQKTKYKNYIIDYNKLKNIDLKKNDIIICLATGRIKYEFFKNINCKKIIDIEDIGCKCGYNCSGHIKCNSQIWINLFNKYFNKFLYRYKSTIIPKNPNKYYFPHFINTEDFRDYKKDKIYDILIFGSICPKIYPLRNKIYNSIKKSNLKVKVINHPGYDKNFKGFRGKELSKIINQSWMTLCTSSINEVLLKKYIEVGLSGSLILGNIPKFFDNFLEGNLLEIKNNDSSLTIISKIKNELENKDKIKEKINYTKNYMIEHYSYQKGLKVFENIIENL